MPKSRTIKKDDVLVSYRSGQRRRVAGFTKRNGRRAAKLERVGTSSWYNNSPRVVVTTIESIRSNYTFA